MKKTLLALALSLLFANSICFAEDTQMVPQLKIDSLQTLINQSKEDKEKVRLLNEFARLNFYNRDFLVGFEAIVAAKDLAERIKYPEGDIMYHTTLAAFLGRHHIYEYHLDEAASLKRQLGVDENFDQLHFPAGYPSERDSSFIVPLNPVRNHFRQLGEMEIEAAIIDASIWAHYHEGNYEQCYIDNIRFIELYKTLGEHYPVFVHYTYISYIADYADIVDMDWLKAEFASFFATVNDIETMSRLYLHIGNFFRNSGQPQKAIEYYLNGSDYYESLNDREMLARIYRSLGELYNRLEMYPQYAEIIEKRISILSDLNRTSEIYEEYEKAVWAMFEVQRFDDARKYIDALITGTTQQNQELLTGNKNNLEGRISMEEGDFKRAIPFLQNSLELYQKADQVNLIPWINMHLATCYFKLGELDIALKYALVSYNDPKYLSGDDKYEKAINYLLSVLYDAKGNQIQAYQHLKKYNDLISEKSNGSDEVFETLISTTIQKSQRDIERLEQEKLREESQNKIQRLWILFISGALIFAIILAIVLYRNIQNKQKANSLLKEQKEEIESTLEKLQSTQSQLIQSEKMASLGELTAGIAHEIQNPLNFVNNFSEVSVDLIEELKDERLKLKNERDEGLEEEILDDVIQNLGKINHHGERASSIVKGMLEHSRTGKQEKELTDLNVLADEYLRLSYHGLRAKDKSFNADFNANLDDKLPKVKVISQDIGRVLLNLINNAFYAVSKKSKDDINVYVPEVFITTKRNDKTVEITVEDNGEGIPKNALDKIFQPFFTTKPTGQGTGLGLSLSYDIITKGHDGHLEVETEEGVGTRFIIRLPIV